LLDHVSLVRLSQKFALVIVFPDLEHTFPMDNKILGIESAYYWTLGLSGTDRVPKNLRVGWGQPLYHKIRNLNYNCSIDLLFSGGARRADRPLYLQIARQFCRDNNLIFLEWEPTEEKSLTLSELSNLMHSSKFVLNFSKVEGDSEHRVNPVTRQWKGRVAEVIGAGSVLLTEKFPGIEVIFDEHEAFSFETPQDLELLLSQVFEDSAQSRVKLFEAQRVAARRFLSEEWILEFTNLLLVKRRLNKDLKLQNPCGENILYQQRLFESMCYWCLQSPVNVTMRVIDLVRIMKFKILNTRYQRKLVRGFLNGVLRYFS